VAALRLARIRVVEEHLTRAKPQRAVDLRHASCLEREPDTRDDHVVQPGGDAVVAVADAVEAGRDSRRVK